MTQAKGLPTAVDALIAATRAADDAPGSERLTSATIGEFAESVGGGWYWSLNFSRTVGNTVTDGKGDDVLADRERVRARRGQVIRDAFTEATTPTP